MIDKRQVFAKLGAVERRYGQLANTFSEFAAGVSGQVAAHAFEIKGILVTPGDTPDRFSVSFAGRTILFAFSVSIGSDTTVVGRVSCYLDKEFPKRELEQIGTFNFKVDGSASESDAVDNDPICIDHPVGAALIALHFLSVALTRP